MSYLFERIGKLLEERELRLLRWHSGHRDTFFRGLSRVRLDDVIQLETLRGTFKYRVERITVVGPQDIEVVRSPEWDLTLVTCFPFHYVAPAPHRYIVQGSRLGTS